MVFSVKVRHDLVDVNESVARLRGEFVQRELREMRSKKLAQFIHGVATAYGMRWHESVPVCVVVPMTMHSHRDFIYRLRRDL